MKSFVFYLLILLNITSCNDNNNPIISNGNVHFNYVFHKTIGGDLAEWGREIIIVPSGGYLIVGRTKSYGIGRNDLFLIRITSQGDMIWHRNFGGDGNNSDDYGHGIVITPDNNILVVGGSNSFSAQGSQYEKYVAKVNMEGDLIWQKNLGLSTRYSQSSVFTVPDGYIIGGNLGEYDSENYFIIKIDFEGNHVWDSVYNGETHGIFRNMTSTSDGGFVLAGTYILKVNESGVPQWTNYSFGNNEQYTEQPDIYSIIETTDGGIVIAGSQFTHFPSFPNDDRLYLGKFNASGTLLWEHNYKTDELLYGGYVVENDDGTFVVCNWNTPSITQPHPNELIISKVSASGNLISSYKTGIIGHPFDLIHGHIGYTITGIFKNKLIEDIDVLVLEVEEK